MASNTDKFDQRILKLVNQERAKQNLKPLTLSQKLDTAADGHSGRMASGDFFSHVDPGNGSRPSDRATKAGYQWSTVGENIAAGQTSPEAVMGAWMNSSGHRANILNSRYAHLGVGYAYLPNDGGRVRYRHYWTQVFGAGDRNPGTYTAQSAPTTTTTPDSSGVVQGTNEIQGTDGNDRLTGNAADQTIYGYAGDDILRGQEGQDLLIGGDGRDVLVGVDPTQQAGQGEIDTLSGGAGADSFKLGDRSKVYYNDGQNNTLGQEDCALIQDFSQAEGDIIQLHGSARDYFLGSAPQGLPEGTAIFKETPGQNELIAVVQNNSDMSLDSSSFRSV
jgi:Ca2+-binding RTX toxin-like protein